MNNFGANVGDTRENDPAYPSTRLSPHDIAELEYEIPSHLAEQGGRLYEQEGTRLSIPIYMWHI